MGALRVILGAWSWNMKKVCDFGSLRRTGFEEAHLVAQLLGVGLAERERGGDGQGGIGNCIEKEQWAYPAQCFRHHHGRPGQMGDQLHMSLVPYSCQGPLLGT